MNTTSVLRPLPDHETCKLRERPVSGPVQPARTDGRSSRRPPKQQFHRLDLAEWKQRCAGTPPRLLCCPMAQVLRKFLAFAPPLASLSPPAFSQVTCLPTKTTLTSLGTAWASSSRRLAQISSPASTLTPVMLPPGRAMLDTIP